MKCFLKLYKAQVKKKKGKVKKRKEFHIKHVFPSEDTWMDSAGGGGGGGRECPWATEYSV